MGKPALATKQNKNEKSKAPIHKVKKQKENLKNQRPRKKSLKLADKEVRNKISTGELQQVQFCILLSNLESFTELKLLAERATEMYTERPEKSLHQVWSRQQAQQAGRDQKASLRYQVCQDTQV